MTVSKKLNAVPRKVWSDLYGLSLHHARYTPETYAYECSPEGEVTSVLSTFTPPAIPKKIDKAEAERLTEENLELIRQKNEFYLDKARGMCRDYRRFYIPRARVLCVIGCWEPPNPSVDEIAIIGESSQHWLGRYACSLVDDGPITHIRCFRGELINATTRQDGVSRPLTPNGLLVIKSDVRRFPHIYD